MSFELDVFYYVASAKEFGWPEYRLLQGSTRPPIFRILVQFIFIHKGSWHDGWPDSGYTLPIYLVHAQTETLVFICCSFRLRFRPQRMWIEWRMVQTSSDKQVLVQLYYLHKYPGYGGMLNINIYHMRIHCVLCCALKIDFSASQTYFMFLLISVANPCEQHLCDRLHNIVDCHSSVAMHLSILQVGTPTTIQVNHPHAHPSRFMRHASKRAKHSGLLSKGTNETTGMRGCGDSWAVAGYASCTLFYRKNTRPMMWFPKTNFLSSGPLLSSNTPLPPAALTI